MEPFIHSHEAYEFIIPFNTIPLLHYQDAVYIGEVGYCFPVNPYVEHGIEFELNSNVISIVIDRKYLDLIKDKLGFNKRYFFTRFLLSKELLKVLSEYRASLNPDLIEVIVSILVSDGLREEIDTRKPSKSYFKKIKDSIIYMSMNYNNPDMTIKDIANKSDYAYTYFTKAFTAFMHETPISYLNRLRLSKAKELIKNKDLSLGEIAKLSGFINSSTFCESFKKYVGMLPKDYKKQFIN